MNILLQNQIIAETIFTFNSNNRAVNSHGNCVLLNNAGNNCALGRYFFAPILDCKGPVLVENANHEINYVLDAQLVPYVRGLPESFWKKLQRLHDCPTNWLESGISARGRDMLTQLFPDYTHITLANLADATEQEVFTQIAIHLLTQNKQSQTLSAVCRYRGLEDLQCAAGCLISDNEYKLDMEYKNWLELVDEYNITPTHRNLIAKLQMVHDNNLPESWPQLLYIIAGEKNYSFPMILRNRLA